VIAVDANGADAGPRAVAEGARLSRERVLLFGPATELGDLGPNVEVVDAPERIGGDEEPVPDGRTRW
jgi:glycerol-3-phosphate acyltransferase PlsX